MKIGIDARFWDESGVGRYTRNLVRQLQKIDKKNTYVLFVSKKNQQEVKNTNCATTKLQVSLGWKIVVTDIHWHSLKEQIEFPQIINKENLDLMHFPYFSVPIFYKKPYLVTIHDLILHHFATGEATTRPQLVYKLKLMGYKFIMKNSARNAKKIITVSNSTKEEIIKHLYVPEEKINVIYEGVSHISSPDNAGTTLQLAPKHSVADYKSATAKTSTLNLKNYLLHVGNLYPHKNMNLVLQSLKKIREEDNRPIQLIIVGKEDYFYIRFQKKVKELGLQNLIHFLGEVSDEKLHYLYQNALALISPSLMEGFDLPVVEAMDNNCLILASDIPVHREICKDAAVYFDPKSPQDLTAKIKGVYKNGKEMYKEKIKSGKSRAAQFKWEQMARETLKVYEGCTGL